MKLKICGMRDRENILQVAALKPDYMGFIFYPQSPRYAGTEFSLPSAFPASTKRVGVFVNEGVEQVIRKVLDLKLDFVQLHGSERPDECDAIRDYGARVIKVFSVDDHFDFTTTKGYDASADYYLFDTKGKYHGGNAKLFDWGILNRYDQRKPFFLSGGISPENIHDIGRLKGMNLYAVDVNSGVEAKPGEKDLSLVKGMIERLKD